MPKGKIITKLNPCVKTHSLKLFALGGAWGKKKAWPFEPENLGLVLNPVTHHLIDRAQIAFFEHISLSVTMIITITI